MDKTTDNQNEIFDVVNENDAVVGKATRGEVHGNPKLIHRSIGVFVINGKGELFLQHRSTTKDTDPLKWTISCSGHVLSGESYEETVFREFKEELGLNIITIEFVVKFIYHSKNETETVMLFKAISDGPFLINKEEITQGKFFTRSKLKDEVRSGRIELSYLGKMSLGKIGWIKQEERSRK